MPKQLMSLEDRVSILKLMKNAPYTYACSSIWYHVAEKYGISIYDDDDKRFKFYEKQGIIGAQTNR